jgi:hypothetical protein
LAREDYGVSKPDPEPYVTAVERLGLPASECLVIEDSERGLSREGRGASLLADPFSFNARFEFCGCGSPV